MKLDNKWASQLLGKDKDQSVKAANHILDNADVEAWQCLVENSEFIFDFIKDKASKMLISQANISNQASVLKFMDYHCTDWENCVVNILAKFENDHIEKQLNEILKNGTPEQKTYIVKYFGHIKNSYITSFLTEDMKIDYMPLKHNIAETLGIIGDKESYNDNIQKLNSQDDWEKVEAAQFLAAYGNKEALLPILKSMESSSMAEHIAGEAAALDYLGKYFDSTEKELAELSLQCFDNITTELSEIWPLCYVFEFKIFECVQKLIELCKTNENSYLIGKYAQLLLNIRVKFDLFKNNNEYNFDEDKATKNEISEIYNLINFESKDFWNYLSLKINEELNLNEKKVVPALRTIVNANIVESVPYIIDNLYEAEGNDHIVYESIKALAALGNLDKVYNIEGVVSGIEDVNLKAELEQINTQKL